MASSPAAPCHPHSPSQCPTWHSSTGWTAAFIWSAISRQRWRRSDGKEAPLRAWYTWPRHPPPQHPAPHTLPTLSACPY
eukprot:2587063-Rhodomonas_salina.3